MQNKVIPDRNRGYERLITVNPANIQLKLSFLRAKILIQPPIIKSTHAILITMLGRTSLKSLIATKVIGIYVIWNTIFAMATERGATSKATESG